MIRFDHATLLDQDGRSLGRVPIKAQSNMCGGYCWISFDETINFPPADRDATATWVMFEQESPGELRVTMTVGELMNTRGLKFLMAGKGACIG